MKIKHAQYYIAVVNDKTLSEVKKQKKLYKFFKGLTDEDLKKVSVQELNEHTKLLSEIFLSGEVAEFERIVKINGKRYGLEPDISNMDSGAFFDLDELVQGNIESNLHKILAILYRPITLKIGSRYDIESYTDEKAYSVEERANLFLHEFDYHKALGVTSFFWNSTPKSSNS